jgi:membrane-associated phospholipid phosphatase
MKKITTISAIILLVHSLGAHANSPASRARVRKIGDYVQLSVPALAFASTAWHKDWAGAGELALVFYTTQISLHTLKHIFPVPRRENFNNKQSFISGHTAVPMACAAFLHQRYGWEIALPAYALSTFVGFSRVYSRAHRINEVIGGAVLGQLIAYVITSSFHEGNVKVVAGINSIGIVVNF